MITGIQNFITNLSDKESKFFYWTIVAVVLAVFDALFLAPILEDLKLTDEKILEQKSSTLSALRILSYKDRIVSEKESVEEYFSELKDEDVLNAEFLGFMERLATRANVNLTKSNPTIMDKERRHIRYYAELDCNGSLENMLTFMHSINTSSQLLKIISLQLTPKRGAGDEVTAAFKVVRMITNEDMVNAVVSSESPEETNESQ